MSNISLRLYVGSALTRDCEASCKALLASTDRTKLFNELPAIGEIESAKVCFNNTSAC